MSFTLNALFLASGLGVEVTGPNTGGDDVSRILFGKNILLAAGSKGNDAKSEQKDQFLRDDTGGRREG